MTVQETKTKSGDTYTIPLVEGTLEYYTDKPIRTKETKKTLDAIFQKLIAKPNGEGKITHEGYIIRYKKDIQLWEK